MKKNTNFVERKQIVIGLFVLLLVFVVGGIVIRYTPVEWCDDATLCLMNK